FYNHYGPTEATIDATAGVVSGEEKGASVSIGKPVANTRAYVLDAWLRPVPTGVPGELYLGGVSLARGYLERPELTAEKFIPDPFASEPGARLYCTADKARWRNDGTLEYLGRLDTQVKVRGFRIELGEVESALTAHPTVRDAVVVVREERLVAYVVAREGVTPEVGTLRQALKQHLPEYMVPAAIALLPALPLTPSGKVDRKALPALEGTEVARTREYVAPHAGVEEQLAAMWAELLRVGRVGRHDDFFELGGHSLLATQLVSRVRAVLGVEIPLRVLFETPTLEALARHVEHGAPSLAQPPLRPLPRSGPLPLSFAQQRLWFLDQLQPGGATYNLPAPVRLSGALHVAALEQSLGHLLQRHEALRTTFPSVRGEPVQAIQPVTPFALPRVDLGAMPEGAREAEARRLAHEDALRPFDLGQGPLLRALLVRLTPSDHVLLLTMHHIVSDGWSTSVLVRELAALYEAFSSGAQPSLPPLPVQYADYAVWQREWLRGDALEAQLGYWKQQLAGAPPALELPTDRPRPPMQTFAGAELAFALPSEVALRLEVLARQHHATVFMVLLAAWQTLLQRYSGQEDFVVGSPIAGRTHAETEGLIGFFVNTLALRARFTHTDTFASLLARVREATLGAYAHQHVPFEKLVEAVPHTRHLSRSPLFQVMFVVQNLPDAPLALPGLQLALLDASLPVAQFDLTLVLTPGPQGLSGALSYNTDLFDASTAARMAGHFQVLLEGLATAPHARLSTLPLLREDERRQLLVEWNWTDAGFPEGACVHELFEAQAQRTPDAPALRFGAQSLSYRELDARANRLAHELRA
ncbi:MAG TPA: condensation domain-containing protein, partial [Myxococcus sp.]|nr:condensation domain-containing protein [Myxococcus sp.]